MRIGHPELNWNETTGIEDKTRAARIRQNQNAQLQLIRAELVAREETNISRYALIGFMFGIVAAIAIELLTPVLVYVL